MKPVSISWEGDRASDVAAGSGENHGLLSEGVGEPWKGKEACCMSLRVGAWRAARRKLPLLHTNYCSFATGEQQLAARSSSECARQTGKLCHPRRRLWTKRPASTPFGVKPRGACCTPLCPMPKVSAGTSSQERWKGSLGA